MTPEPQPPPAIFLFGPTAVGKTNLLDLLAPDVYEVVSADSLQVYRRLDIGTAKPSLEARTRLRHHLIDIVDPREQFDVGEFVRLAENAISEIRARGRIPIVSGGAGFYLKQLLYGLPSVPASTPEIRTIIQARLAELGLPTLYEQLKAVDPATAERLAPADGYRITRALEVFETSGRPLSDFPLPDKPRSDLTVKLIGLERSRPELHRRIGIRVAGMFAAGLRREIEDLIADGYDAEDPGLGGIGYREFFDSDGNLRPSADDEEISAEIQKNTRRYSKRQITFFRGLPEVAWIPAEATADVVDNITVFAQTIA